MQSHRDPRAEVLHGVPPGGSPSQLTQQMKGVYIHLRDSPLYRRRFERRSPGNGMKMHEIG